MYSIIVVDDEDIIRTSITRYIQTLSYFETKGSFPDGNDAVAYIRNNPVDIIISDIRMPGMNGLELAEYVSKNNPDTIMILVTGYGEFEYARKAIRFGVFHYILKPMDFSELQDTLMRAKAKLDSQTNNASIQEDNVRSFFFGLLDGKICDPYEIQQRFQSLPLGRNPTAYKGCILSASPELPPNLDSNHTLTEALLSFIRNSLPHYKCYLISDADPQCSFIILSPDGAPDISTQQLEETVYSYLFVPCQFHCHSYFNSILELADSGESSEKNLSEENDLTQSEIDSSLIQPVINFIHQHYGDTISREDAANIACLSSNYFSRFFKRSTGVSFMEYLTKVRMDKACELLSTNLTINEISQKVGYLSRNRFCINFQQHTGHTPSDYRKMIQTNGESK